MKTTADADEVPASIDPDAFEPVGLRPISDVLDVPMRTPAPIRTGEGEPPIADSNVVRLFRYPMGSGMWFAQVGVQGQPGALLYGPLRTPYQVLVELGKYLKRRGHAFDSCYTPLDR